MPRAAVRLLHPRVRHHHHRLPPRASRPVRAGRPRGDRRQPLPLHRLPEHRRLGAPRRRAAALGEPGGGQVTTRMFGEPIARLEDPRLVGGHGRYLDDLGPQALAAAFVRSPHAHARIADIDAAEALEDACERIRVAYDPLPPVVGIQAAVRAEHAVHDDVPDNVAAHMVQEVGDARAAIAAAPHRLELDLEIERSASMPMEGKGVYARWDAADRSLRVYSSTQTSTSVRFALAAKLEVPVDRVEVVTPDVGGGFGVKIVHPWPEEVLVPWAAIRLGR